MSNRQARTIRIADRQGWKCYYCQRPMVHRMGRSDSVTIDHKNPLHRGGDDAAVNLVACCWRCNQVKGSMTAAEFFKAWGDMSRLPERYPGSLADAGAQLRRLREKELNRRVALLGQEAKSSKKMPKPPADLKPCGLVRLGDLADLRKVLPLHVRLDMAWAALWEHCLETVDAQREKAA